MTSSEGSGSSERFGYEWDTYGELLDNYQEQFRRWTVGLTDEKWRGARFLDVGCGMGRNSYWAMRHGAAGGVAVDLDERSLAHARRNLRDFPSVKVEHESAYDLAFSDEFNIVFSIGVIHHLEHPELALSKMFRATKPGASA